MAYSRNPTWVDGVAGGTRIDAVDLNNIEDGLVAAANVADTANAGLATKVNVSDAVSLAGSGDLPIIEGTAFQGSANAAARSDHIHPATVAPRLATGIPVSSDYHPGRITGTAWTPVIGRTYLQLHPVFTVNQAGLTVSGVATLIGTGGSADSALKVALFRSQSTGFPDFTNPIVPSTTITTAASTGRLSATLASNVTVPDGWYWKALIVTGTTSPAFKSTADTAKVWLRNASVVDQYSATRIIVATRTAFPANNADTLDYESVNDIAPLVLVVV